MRLIGIGLVAVLVWLAYLESANDSGDAAQWLAKNATQIRYPSGDVYSSLSASIAWPKPGPRNLAAGLWLSDYRYRCRAVACFYDASWSFDHRFIAFAVVGSGNRWPAEVFAVRVRDRRAIIISAPAELLDPNRLSRHYITFYGLPTWRFPWSVTFSKAEFYDRESRYEGSDVQAFSSSEVTNRLPLSFALNRDADRAFTRPGASLSQNLGSLPSPAAVGPKGLFYLPDTNSLYVTGLFRPSLYARVPLGSDRAVLKKGTDSTLHATAVASGVTYDSRNRLLYLTAGDGLIAANLLGDSPMRMAVRGGLYGSDGIVFDPLRKELNVVNSLYNEIVVVTATGIMNQYAGRCVRGPYEPNCVNGNVDGQGAAARFNTPGGITIDSRTGTLYVADTGNNEIRKITNGGKVSTVAGSCDRIDPYPNCLGGLVNGQGRSARFFFPEGLAFDPVSSTLYVADQYNNTIRQVTADGTVATVAGSSEPGFVDGRGPAARFNLPYGLIYDGNKRVLYVSDRNNNAIRRITADRQVTTLIKDLPRDLSFNFEPKMASVKHRPVLFAIGASETLGYGLEPQQTYPAILTTRCNLSMRVIGHVGEAALAQTMPRPEPNDIVTVFVGLNDVLRFDVALHGMEIERKVDMLSNSRHMVIVFMPPIDRIPSFKSAPQELLLRQKALYQAVSGAAKQKHVPIISLTVPRAKEKSYFQTDGLHPTYEAEEYIAGKIIQTLNLGNHGTCASG